MSQMMRSILSSLLLSCVGTSLLAQESSDSIASLSALRPATCAVSFQVGNSKVRDTYLTPLAYTGTSLGLQLERWRTMPSYRWTAQQRLDADLSLGENNSGNSSMNSGRLRYRYALMYDLQLSPSFALKAGSFAGLEVGFDYNLKMAAGNNPATVRFCHNVGAAVAGVTHYRLHRQDCSVMLQAQAPLLGAALMPEYGASYYETFLLQTTDHVGHFTSLHNQQDLEVRLTTDVPLAVICRRWDSTLRLGTAYRIETMRINDITTRYSAFQVVIGWVYQYLPYNRKKSHLFNESIHEAY